jgi:hypothetical protein
VRYAQSEQDNDGVQSAHKLEETAEGGYRIGRSAYRSNRLKPYRAAAHSREQSGQGQFESSV